MKKILFPIEKALLLFFFIQMVFEMNCWIYLGITVTLLLFKIQYEGARPVTPIFIVVIIVRFFNLSILQSILVIITLVLTFVLRFYDINVPLREKYLVGHKYERLQNNGHSLLISFLYPTNQKGTKVEWVPNQKYNKTLYDIFYVDPKMRRAPYQLFKFIVSFAHKIWIPVQGNTPYYQDPANKNKKKVIILSHGLGGHINMYSSFTVNLASQGYIVVTLNHDHDQVRLDYRETESEDLQMIRAFLHKARYRDLKIRVSQIRKILDQLLDEKLLKKCLNIQFEIEEIILAGQSYGGGTVFSTKSILNKEWADKPEKLNLITKIIGLDPWMFPMTDQLHQNLENENILIINSETFMQLVPKEYELQDHFTKLKKNSPNLKAYIIKKMDHIGQSDNAYVFGNALQLTGSVKFQAYTDYFIALNNIIIREFMADKSKEQIMEIANKFAQQKKIDKVGIEVSQEYRLTRQLTFSSIKN